MSWSPRPAGIYPMLYAFFSSDGSLDRNAMRRQVQACVANGAHGVAILGLATEVEKLSEQERHQLVEWVSEDLAERLPLAVTVFGETVEQQVAFARHAQRCGAAWVILQPPRISSVGESDLVSFFGKLMDQLDMTVAIQNAPQYIGIGLTDDGIDDLIRHHDNFTVLKGEGPVLQVRNIIERHGERLAVLNGRAGLELTDNLRAGCAGMIPGLDLFDLQARCFDAMSAGDEDVADALYARALPAIVFVMQSIEHLVCYGKRIAAQRLRIDATYDRSPALSPTAFGIDCAQRHARRLGYLA
ncbi:MAG: dihydrodipicolinate synthase family protein [Betaproteobacteria bacterium]|nr:MAG: dihydrodipicolinate synthase family protein [Betaproteobacteria bacterium]